MMKFYQAGITIVLRLPNTSRRSYNIHSLGQQGRKVWIESKNVIDPTLEPHLAAWGI